MFQRSDRDFNCTQTALQFVEYSTFVFLSRVNRDIAC